MLQADLAQLKAQVRKHAAGHLVLVLRVVVFHRRADGEAFALGDGGEMARYRLQDFFVDIGFVTQRAGVFGDVEQRRIGSVVGQRRQARC